MGYRSNVKVLVYVPSSHTRPDDPQLTEEERTQKYEALKVLLKTTFRHIDEEFGNCVEFCDDSETMIFTMDNVKWYTDYSDVRDFETFLTCLSEELNYVYEFGRLGEEDDDVEFRRSEDNEYRLSVSREFCW